MSRTYKPRDPYTVSAYMSRIKSSGSQMERLLGKAMWNAGLRYRKQFRILGRPDFAFPGVSLAVFCDSCFWHGYGWHDGSRPDFKKNKEFWHQKIEKNVQRDKFVNAQLELMGWTVKRFWEYEIFDELDRCVELVKDMVAQKRSGLNR